MGLRYHGEVRGRDANPLRLRHGHLDLGSPLVRPVRAAIDDLPAIERLEDDGPDAARPPALPGTRGGQALSREPPGDPNEPAPAGDLLENPDYDLGLGLVFHPGDMAACLADVAIAEEPPAGHVPLLGLRTTDLPASATGLPPVHLVHETEHRGVDLATLILDADAAAAALVAPDRDPGLFERLDGQQHAPGIAAEPRLLHDHEDREGRRRVEGRHQARVGGELGQPVHVLLAEVRLERVGAVALELLAVYQPSNSVTRTPRALASFTTTCERTS